MAAPAGRLSGAAAASSGAAQARRIDRRSLTQQAVDQLRGRILAGELPPGTRLVETALAETAGLSRSTLRAALVELSHEGLVTQVAYTRWSVAELDADAVSDLYALRSALEGLGARLAAERITKRAAGQLQRALDRLVRAATEASPAALTRADFALHELIIVLSNNAKLADHYRLIDQQVRMLIASSNALAANPDEIVRQHRPIVDAIVAGRAAAAETLIREHHTSEGRRLAEHVRGHGGAGSQPHIVSRQTPGGS